MRERIIDYGNVLPDQDHTVSQDELDKALPSGFLPPRILLKTYALHYKQYLLKKR
jgi:hypothetical protein